MEDIKKVEIKPIHVKPTIYAYCLEAMKEIGLKYGYNIVIHGSMNRDLDVIAIPWEEEVGDLVKMINQIAEALGGYILDDASREKPHGRVVYVVNINRTVETKFNGMMSETKHHADPQFYVDISVMPTKECCGNWNEEGGCKCKTK